MDGPSRWAPAYSVAVTETNASPPEPGWLFLLRLLAVLLLLAACLFAPAVGRLTVGHWGAVLGGVLGLTAWARLGPRPMPGFLPGLLCVSGLVGIVVHTIAAVAR